MKLVCQRVRNASVSVDGDVIANIGEGLCLLVGVASDDAQGEVEAAVAKIANLRIFSDADGKMNRSVIDVGGEILLVSQFTLCADVRRGRRPSFADAAPPDTARRLIEGMVASFEALGVRTSEGEFGAKMVVELANDGPVTLVLEVKNGQVH